MIIVQHQNGNTSTTATVSEIIKRRDFPDPIQEPLPLSVIPNHMGINLCSVHGMTWTKQPDGQLVDLTIHFKPAEEEQG